MLCNQERRAVHHLGGLEAAEQDPKPCREEGHSQDLGCPGQESGHDAADQGLGTARNIAEILVSLILSKRA